MSIASRRSPLEVSFEILNCLKSIHKPTKLMYETNTSWVNCQNHLAQFVESGLVTITLHEHRVKRVRRSYHLTEKGESYVMRLEKVRDIMIDLRPEKGRGVE